MTKWNKTIVTCKRRCWTCKSCSSCSLRCIKRSNAAAFFFQVVSSSKYAILQELNCDYGSYTRLCFVELLRTDWGRCSEAGLLYVHVTMTHGKRLSYPNSAVFADTVVPSRCHRTIIRWLHDSIARPKMLPPLTKLLSEPEKLHRRSYDGLRCPHEWPDGFTMRAEFEHFLYRVSIWCQFRECDASIMRIYQHLVEK